MSKIKTVFVSVPMNGKDDAMIERAIQIAKRDYCRAHNIGPKDVEFIDIFHDMYLGIEDMHKKRISNKTHPSLVWLGKAIELIADCDEAIFGEGWKTVKRCKCEREICGAYGIPITEVRQKEIETEAIEKQEKWKNSESGKRWRQHNAVTIILIGDNHDDYEVLPIPE